MLLGLLRFDKEQPAIVLSKLGISIGELIKELEDNLPQNKNSQFGDVPFTSNAASVLRILGEKSKKEKCCQVEPIDFLLALLKIKSCTAAHILNKYGITKDKVQETMKTEQFCRGDR